MELSINLNYEQVLNLVNQLPFKDRLKLKKALQEENEELEKRNSILDLLLEAPTWNEEDFDLFKQARESINKSRIA